MRVCHAACDKNAVSSRHIMHIRQLSRRQPVSLAVAPFFRQASASRFFCTGLNQLITKTGYLDAT